jgi:hypothetical protein
MPDPKELYKRKLPGGGYVAIEEYLDDDATYHARVRVERRSETSRRFGHPAPVVVDIPAAQRESTIDELRVIAGNNVELAKALLRWQAARRDKQD